MIEEELLSLIAVQKYGKARYSRLLDFYSKDRAIPKYYIEECLECYKAYKEGQ
ncbi:hypothetical protein [Bacillus cereus]|uniref:hypothetical protein n=1 Tax=Bacillus cereus TaxID=1396 RepID=UPI0015D4BD78|nr:hypothetical protein [Bacillus cereus]